MLRQLFIPSICRTRHLVQDGSTEEDGGDKNLRTRLEVGSWPEDSRTNTNCFSITGIHRGEHWRIVHHLCMYRSPPQPPPPTTEDASSPVRDRGTPESTNFTTVRGGARPVPRTIFLTHCFNRFAILEEEEEQQSTFSVGDSMTRHQVGEFCGRLPRRRRNYCYPGARLDDITAALDDVSAEASNDSSCSPRRY